MRKRSLNKDKLRDRILCVDRVIHWRVYNDGNKDKVNFEKTKTKIVLDD